MDNPQPSARSATAMDRLAALDRLYEVLSEPGLTRDRILAELQEQVHALASQAATAEAGGDRTLARQLQLVAHEVAWLAKSW
ncbi:MAG TPA: hypothetical protein VFE65_02625 [Pseudonocardia sp.]|jgi:hypothetical protein|nr:hypothetical protein [Pseudonocardia sp.]